MISFFWKQPFVLADGAHTRAGAMAHTRAGPSSALQICPAISKLLSLCNPSGTAVIHRAGREGDTSNVYITDLPGNYIIPLCIPQFVYLLGTVF